MLSFERALKDAGIGLTKTHSRGRHRLGATTVQCWVDHVRAWRTHPLVRGCSLPIPLGGFRFYRGA